MNNKELIKQIADLRVEIYEERKLRKKLADHAGGAMVVSALGISLLIPLVEELLLIGAIGFITGGLMTLSFLTFKMSR